MLETLVAAILFCVLWYTIDWARSSKTYSIFGGGNRKQLGILVREMMADGYKPVGSPITDDNGYWYQAMVK